MLFLKSVSIVKITEDSNNEIQMLCFQKREKNKVVSNEANTMCIGLKVKEVNFDFLGMQCVIGGGNSSWS